MYLDDVIKQLIEYRIKHGNLRVLKAEEIPCVNELNELVINSIDIRCGTIDRFREAKHSVFYEKGKPLLYKMKLTKNTEIDNFEKAVLL